MGHILSLKASLTNVGEYSKLQANKKQARSLTDSINSLLSALMKPPKLINLHGQGGKLSMLAPPNLG